MEATDSLYDMISSPYVLASAAVGVGALFAAQRYFSPKTTSARAAVTNPTTTTTTQRTTPTTTVVRTGVLDPERFQEFKLAEKIILTHNTRLFRFALPNSTDVLGLPIGQHMSLRAKVDGKDVYRPYTPTSSDDDLGHFDLVVKVYPGGKMTEYLDRLEVGQGVEVKGPKGKFKYAPNMKKAIGMIAGGTGITPMLQVIAAILKNPADKTKVSLIFGNITEEDILVREKLEALAAQYPEQFHLYFTLDKPPEGWAYGSGFINPAMIQEHLPGPDDEHLVVMCGPSRMNEFMMGNLQKMGYKENHYFTF
eukprot:TRINITY_DN564_c0_g1_i1.p1 TRINITY_DN564_c0_g1~~TRINITY_DN564_c0_g1_i1.p1  ORF type:complete len:308 (+),score=66.08 TRINITY_DN564_c0_g1_i1:129-1052(+)